jgi:hypothetical protein
VALHDPMMAVLAGKLGARSGGLRAGRREVDVEPAGAEQTRADALSQGQSQSDCHQAIAGRCFPKGTQAGAERND